MNFTFTFWNYGTFDRYYGDAETAVNEWKELGLTLGFTFRYIPSTGQKDRMMALLDACARENIQVIVSDKRMFVDTLMDGGEDAYIAAIQEAEEEFGGHSAVWGWYVGDEPSHEKLATYARAAQLVRQHSKKEPFVNFYPTGSKGREDYGSRQNYFDALSAATKDLPVLAFDRYSQCTAREFEVGWTKFCLEEYFYDLNGFVKTAKRANMPCWMSALSVGHWNFRTPTIDDVRWQISSMFAHGVGGIQWFFLYQHRWADDYHGYAVQLSGHKTELYYDIAQETKSFTERVIKPLDGYRHEKTYHISAAFADTELLLSDSDPTYDIYAYHKMNGILTRFVNDEGECKYLLVNNEQRSPEVFGITDKRTKQYRTIWLPAGGSTVLDCKKE